MTSRANTVPRSYRRRPPNQAEQERRKQWGIMAGAKVAAAYKQRTEEH